MNQAVAVDKQTMEKYSSAFTLSDMEVFLFPDLLYALVLANIMSPRIWQWREDPWFSGIEKLTFNRQVQRLKQYIMDHYSFNLDLETWGLTTKARELERFSSFIDPGLFSRSNALFGYEGDKYYFDLDIRRHFGLDQYTSDVIPYWKTETVEAMDAFRHKTGHTQGAGECVSLSALYAAALFIVLKVPLEDIFLLATPLHSQNFVLKGEGVITNNRRVVTKTMWFNGTELSTKARRALEKERITIVSHCSGYTHIEYAEATIGPHHYQRLKHALSAYLTIPVNFEIFANFLRVYEKFRKYFQFEYQKAGKCCYLDAEVLYRYEHGSKGRVGDASRKKLLEEVETEEFDLQPKKDRFPINILEKKLNGQPLKCRPGESDCRLKEMLDGLPEIDELCECLHAFICIAPKLPGENKHYREQRAIELSPAMTRSEIIRYLKERRDSSETIDLAFYANRQVDERGWSFFMKACTERNPVSIEAFKETSLQEVYEKLKAMPDASIYDEQGLATPDEVVNYKRGDGLEKAVTLVNVALAGNSGEKIVLRREGPAVYVESAQQTYVFPSKKDIAIPVWDNHSKV